MRTQGKSFLNIFMQYFIGAVFSLAVAIIIVKALPKLIGYSNDLTDDNLLAQSIILIGTLLTFIISFVTVMQRLENNKKELRHKQENKKKELKLKQENNKNELKLKQEAEERFRNEVLLKTIDHFGNITSDDLSFKTSLAMVLFSRFNAPDLALDLYSQLLDQGKNVETSTFIRIVDAAFCCEDVNIQNQAADKLYNHCKTIEADDLKYIKWPASIKLNWPLGLSNYARRRTADSIIYLLTRINASTKNSAGWFLLHLMWLIIKEKKEQPKIRGKIAYVVDFLIKNKFPIEFKGKTLYLVGEDVDLDILKNEVKLVINEIENDSTIDYDRIKINQYNKLEPWWDGYSKELNEYDYSNKKNEYQHC